LKSGKVDGATDRVAVDEEEWSAIDSKPVAFLAVGLHLRLEAVAVEILGEPHI